MALPAHALALLVLLAGDNLNGGWDWAVPGDVEPKFEEIREDSLPPGAQVKMRMSAMQVIEEVRRKYDLASDVAGMTLASEALVLSGATYFRRAVLRTTVYGTENMHGYCGQHIYVWFDIHGAIAGIYGGTGFCPV